MTTSQLVAMRFVDLLAEGNVGDALNYLSEDVVYNTWLGVVYGKENVATFLRDNVRFVHHSRNYNRWKQVHHCFDPSLKPSSLLDRSGVDCGDFINSGHVRGFGRLFPQTLSQLDVQAAWRYLNLEGYDSQGYAMFERDGTIASHAKFAIFHVKVKETVVLHNNKVVLVNISKRV